MRGPSFRGEREELLARMSVPIEGIRPAMSPETLADTLADYLRFRYVLRNVYGFELKWERCQPVAHGLTTTRDQLEASLRQFETTLQGLAANV